MLKFPSTVIPIGKERVTVEVGAIASKVETEDIETEDNSDHSVLFLFD